MSLLGFPCNVCFTTKRLIEHTYQQTTTGYLMYKKIAVLKRLLLSLAVSSSYLYTAALSANVALPSIDFLSDSSLEQYQQTLKLLSYKQFDQAHLQMAKLAGHPLYPYLLKEDLEQRIKRYPYTEVEQFLSTYGDTIAGRQFRHQWLTALAKSQRWDTYLKDYKNQSGNKKLTCWYIEALHQSGYSQLALEKTADVWLDEGSLPSACNGNFRRWQQAGLKTDQLVWQRLTMALNANNMRLASYLKRRASAQLSPDARRLYSVHNRPALLKDAAQHITGSEHDAEIISHGLSILAYQQPDLTTQLWQDYQRFNILSDQQNSAIRQHISRQMIASGDEKALSWLIMNDPNASDPYLLEWRIRLAIKNQQWSDVKRWTQLLPEDLQQQPRWQYWLAKSYLHFDELRNTGDELLSGLANQRHYYGFLAAQSLGVPYQFNHSALDSEIAPSTILSIPGIQRAQAFFKLNNAVQARREWRSVAVQLEQPQLLAATALAHQWGWHQQAILTTLKAQHFDDLDIRFPLAHRDSIFTQASSTDIKPEWIYAITRQESAFASDAFSSAGAEGLMQLKPSTAKQLARSLGMSYKKYDLFNENKNITLGSHYLQRLLSRFNGNRILATAAYNAGPYRLNRWLSKQQKTVDYDVWIETLPFYETRDYVQNVLAFSVIYGHQLGSTTALIEADEQVIYAADDTPH